MQAIGEEAGGHRPSMQTTFALDEENNYSKVWIRGAYLRDITRQIAISRADLHRTCRDVASSNEMHVCTCVRFRAEPNILETRFLITIRRFPDAAATPR